MFRWVLTGLIALGSCLSLRADIIYQVDHTFGDIRMHGSMSVTGPKTITSMDDFSDYSLTWEDAAGAETSIFRSKSGIALQLVLSGDASLIAGADDLRSVVVTPLSAGENILRIRDADTNEADGYGDFQQSSTLGMFMGIPIPGSSIELMLDGTDADFDRKTQPGTFVNNFQLGVAAVPEPTSAAILAVVSGGLVFRRRRVPLSKLGT